MKLIKIKLICFYACLFIFSLNGQFSSKNPVNDYTYISIHIDNSEKPEGEMGALSDALSQSINSIDRSDDLEYLPATDFNKNFVIITTEYLLLSLISRNENSKDYDILKKNYLFYIIKNSSEDDQFVVCIPKIKGRTNSQTNFLDKLGLNKNFLVEYKLYNLNPNDNYFNIEKKIKGKNITNFFIQNISQKPKIIYITGHGLTESYIAGMSQSEFKIFLNDITENYFNTKLLFISTCYIGGINSFLIKNLTFNKYNKKIKFPIISQGSLETSTYTLANDNFVIRYFFEKTARTLLQIKNQDQEIKKQDKALLKGTYYTIFYNKNSISENFSFEEYDTSFKDTNQKNHICFENIPKILNPDVNYWILPEEIGNIKIVKGFIPKSINKNDKKLSFSYDIDVPDQFKNLVIFNAKALSKSNITIHLKKGENIESFGKIILISNKDILINSIIFLNNDGKKLTLTDEKLNKILDYKINYGKKIRIANRPSFEFYKKRKEVSLFIPNYETNLYEQKDLNIKNFNLYALKLSLLSEGSESFKNRILKACTKKLKELSSNSIISSKIKSLRVNYSKNKLSRIKKLLKIVLIINNVPLNTVINLKDLNSIFLEIVNRGFLDYFKLLLKFIKNINFKNDAGDTALILASYKGHYKMVKLLLKKRVNVNFKNDNGDTALIAASYRGYEDIVRVLLKRVKDINETNNKGNTALISASSNGHENIIKLLLKNGVNVNLKNGDGNTALILASYKGYKNIISRLLTKVKDINEANDNGNTALISASANGHEDIVKLLLKKDVNVNLKNNHGDTALLLASSKGYEDIVKLLLEKDVNVNLKNNHGNTALLLASAKGYDKIVNLLLKNRANINETNYNGDSALILASMKGHDKVVRLFLKRVKDINETDYNGNTALIWASVNSYEKVVNLLLGNGADINKTNDNGDTALILTSALGREDLVKLLLEKGANINAKNKNGKTALSLAVKKGYYNILRLLLEKSAYIKANKLKNPQLSILASKNTPLLILASALGYKEIVELILKNIPNVKVRNKGINSALNWAVEANHYDIARILLEKLAKIKPNASKNTTLLILASALGRESVVRLFLRKGEDVNETAGNGYTALIAASAKGYENIVKLLLKNGADINAKSKNGDTALIVASKNDHRNVVKLLLGNKDALNMKKK